MKRLAVSLILLGLVHASPACDQGSDVKQDASRPGAGGSGAAGGAGGTGGAAGGGGTGGRPGVDATADQTSPTDVAASDAPPPDSSAGFAPPKYPPPFTRTCATGCDELRRNYADAVLRLQNCSPGAGSQCGFKAPGHLGCGGCEVWVNDVRELVPLYQRFNDMGCYGCYFDGDNNRCHAIACPSLLAPMCTAVTGGQGSCTNDDRCPPTAITGAACPLGITCVKGPQDACYCDSMSKKWVCF